MRRILVAILVALSLAPVALSAEPAQNAARDESRAQHLFTEVRCVQCQSQDIADSDAQIAGDMRREIRAAVHAGQSDAQIRKTLYDHYGDYVLFRPRLSAGNLVLWLLPPLIVLAGLFGFVTANKSKAKSSHYELDKAEEEKLREIMKNPE